MSQQNLNYFSKIHYHMPFQDRILSDANVVPYHDYAHMPWLEKYDSWVLIHFRENLWNCSEFESGLGNTEGMVISLGGQIEKCLGSTEFEIV